MLNLGLLLALACALTAQVALLCKHRGAVAAPDVDVRHPLRSAAGLFASKWFAIGFGDRRSSPGGSRSRRCRWRRCRSSRP